MTTDIRKFLHERDIEGGAVELSINPLNIFIVSIYGAPSSNFALFLDKLEMILNLLHNNNNIQLIICGDININYLDKNNKKKKTFQTFYWPLIT